MTKPRLRLVDRLRGVNRIPVNDGAGLLNGDDSFTCNFSTPPIQKEAAGRIEELEEALTRLWKAVKAYDRIGYEGSELLEAMSEARAVLQDRADVG